MIRSDIMRLKQVLLNFLSNAYKFTFQGSIKITVCSVKMGDNDFIKFCVSDTGIGIKQENQCKLFKLFSMINNDENPQNSNDLINPNGCGIGLTVSKRYIEYLKGSISLKSELGKGTSVTFHIPLVRVEVDSISSASTSNKSIQNLSNVCEFSDVQAFQETDMICSRHLFEKLQRYDSFVNESVSREKFCLSTI